MDARRGGFRRLIFVVIVGMVIAMPRTAAAALMRSYDIASLAFEAQEIVLVEKVKHWELKEQLREFETVRVKRSYAGSALQPGAEITIETTCYGFEPMFGWDEGGRGKRKPVVSDERVLFLSPRGANAWDGDSGAPAMEWGLESSGMRIFVDGRVNRFEQEMNPGCYGPLAGEGPKNAPYTRAAFEQALAVAIATAKEAHALLGAPASPQRTEKLLAIVGPAADAPAAVRHSAALRDKNVGLDQIATAILEDFAKAGDVPAVLEAHARTKRVDLFMSRIDIPPDRLADAARSTLPVRQRLSAVTLLTQGSFMASRTPGLGDLFTTLLSDPAPEIRRAALNAPFSNNATPPAYLDALVAQFGIEKDPRVRLGIFQRAKRESIAHRLTIPASELPLAAGSLDDGTIAVSWAVLDGQAGWPESVTLELRKNGALVSRETVPDGYSTSTSGTDTSIYLADLTAPPGVSAGVYDVFVDLKIAADARTTVTRRVSIGPMDLGLRSVTPIVPTSPEPSTSPARVTSTAPRERTPVVVTSPIVERTRDLALLPGPRILSGALFGLFVGFFVVQRLRRRAARSQR